MSGLTKGPRKRSETKSIGNSIHKQRPARKRPKESVIKALFAKSGNQCAFPACDHPLIDDKNILVCELCHINAISEEGARYDASLSEDALRDYDNLILLCHAHHRRIDSLENEYPVDKIKMYKHEHEQTFIHRFRVSNSIIKSIVRETLQQFDLDSAFFFF